MSKLDILITQYNETDTIIQPMLDSLKVQQGINWQDIHIYIGNDGSDTKLSSQFLESYNLPIQYINFAHRGLAGLRQNLFDISSSEYVIFCDADDMFHSAVALHNILALIQAKQPDAIVFDFIEECQIAQQKLVYIKHTNDGVFVHGKIYRRQYLIDNNIRWHQELGCHQDSCFNVFALTLTNNKINSPFLLYIWKWNEQSITRRDSWHLIKSWGDMIRSYESLVKDFLIHQIPNRAAIYAYWCLRASYEMMMRTWWQEADSTIYDDQIYLMLKNFYYTYKVLLQSLTEEQQNQIAELIQESTKKRGAANYTLTFDQWLENIIRKDDRIYGEEISQ